jgi:Crp-like helix-turn-helix domain
VAGAYLVRKRLARVLLRLADLGKDGKPEAVIAKISEESLAEMIGTTRSRVSFFMNKFRKLGFVAYNRGSASAARCSTSSSTSDAQIAPGYSALRVAQFFKS